MWSYGYTEKKCTESFTEPQKKHNTISAGVLLNASEKLFYISEKMKGSRRKIEIDKNPRCRKSTKTAENFRENWEQKAVYFKFTKKYEQFSYGFVEPSRGLNWPKSTFLIVYQIRWKFRRSRKVFILCSLIHKKNSYMD